MGQRTVKFSDLSGNEIPEGDGAQVRVFWADKRKTPWAIDLTEEEAKTLLGEVAQPIRRRARRSNAAKAKAES